MHRGPHGHLHRFRIKAAGLAKILKNEPEQPAYFPLDFPLKRFGRFFSGGDNELSIGRTAQSCSLTSTTWSQRF
jgi:hypothetical protein